MKLKKIFYSLALLSSFSLFTACSDVFSLDFTKQESVDKLRGRLAEEIDENVVIVDLSFGSDDEGFSSTMNYAMVTYYEGDEMKAKRVSLGGGGTRDWKPSFALKSKKPEYGAKLSEIDFSNIAANVQKGIAMFESDPINLQFSGIGGYDIKFSEKSKGTLHEFSLQSRGGTKMTTASNGRLATETEYYELDFEVTPEGDVVWVR